MPGLQTPGRGGVVLNTDSILARIRPQEKERKAEEKMRRRVFKILEGYPVKPILVGSIAKDTDLAGNKDLDIFIQFPPQVPRQELEKQGLRIGKAVFTRLGGAYEIDYAEHPYVKGVVEDIQVEIVPCYSGGSILSAVDRTPQHTEYVRGKLASNSLNDEIRLMKQFMRGIGVYGAEAKVEGFSGYLVELLVICYGSFLKCLEAGRTWDIPEIIDMEKLWDDPRPLARFFTGSNLIVVDPVDRNRNVAAAVSPECLSRFMVKADEYVNRPSEDFFFPKPKPMRKADALGKAMKERKTKFICVLFRHERMNANILYSQLRKTMRNIAAELAEAEFKVFRDAFWTNENDSAVLLFELEVWSLPVIVHRVGPPLHQDAHNQERFVEKYRQDKPYIKDGRWVVDTKRRYRTALQLMPEILAKKKGFGKNIRDLKDVEVLEDSGLFMIKDPGWLGFLNGYLD
ncbi:MAG: CCA tRNA nucleotidyltransferase [Candidatus Altiarchaeota archaeon]